MPKRMPVALTPEFASDPGKLSQWSAFLRKNDLKADSLGAVIQRLAEFLGPVLGDEKDAKHWTPSDHWKLI